MNPWFGVLAPAGTPSPIIAKLSTELDKWGKVITNAGIRGE